jgi:hypothetical protein
MVRFAVRIGEEGGVYRELPGVCEVLTIEPQVFPGVAQVGGEVTGQPQWITRKIGAHAATSTGRVADWVAGGT